MRALNIFVLILACLTFTACSVSKMAAKILPDTVETQMESIIDALERHDLDFIKSHGSDDFKALENIDESMQAIFDYIYPGEAQESKLVNAQTHFSKSIGATGVTTYTGQYERIYAKGTIVYSLVLEKVDGEECCAVRNINVNKFAVSPSQTSKFSLKDKGLKHYIFLFFAVLVPLFIIVTLIKCIRTKGINRKWLWVLFIVFGIYGITLNWTSGDLTLSFISKTDNGLKFSFLDLTLLGASATKSSYLSPWLVKVGFPLGAVLFRFRLRKMERERVEVFVVDTENEYENSSLNDTDETK